MPVFEVELVAVWPDRTVRKTMMVRGPLSALALIEQAGGVGVFGFDPAVSPVIGCYGKKLATPAQYLVQPGDRLELYRSLLTDPKQARRRRAARTPVGRLTRRR